MGSGGWSEVQHTTHSTLLARLGDRADREAWYEFAHRYGDLVRGFARRRGLQPADCEDVLQDVMGVLAKNMPSFEYDRSKGRFRGYLKTITLRAVFRRFRQNPGDRGQGGEGGAVEQSLLDPEIESSWEVEWRQYHLRQAMRVVEGEFGGSQLTAFRLNVLRSLPAATVAELVNTTVDTVYQAKSRIMRRLSELIEVQVADEG